MAGETTSVPIAVSGGPFTSLDARGVCAVDVNGLVYCWQGYPGPAARSSPTFPVTALSVGYRNSLHISSLQCATDANAILWCWDGRAVFFGGGAGFYWWDFNGPAIGSGIPLRVAGQP